MGIPLRHAFRPGATPGEAVPVPPLITVAGEHAVVRFTDFFTTTTRNPNTQIAYRNAICRFFDWLGMQGVAELGAIGALHVRAYMETLIDRKKPPTVKQHLAALRGLFDWLIDGQIVGQNPAAAVHVPRHAVKKSRTRALTNDEMRRLFKAIDLSTIIGLRDRALIATLTFACARISAALGMNVEDYRPHGRFGTLSLHEKDGSRHNVPMHHVLRVYLDEYVVAAGIATDTKAPLFQTVSGRSRGLSGKRMARSQAYDMLNRSARRAGIFSGIGCHSFRATGIINYLSNGGSLGIAQGMAAHRSPHTTQLYNHRVVQITHDDVEKIRL
jgi:site-specific recombinase XerD